MEHHTLDNWSKDFRPDGLLYFTQRIEEMLTPSTDHIFKMPVLNTALLVDEYLENAKLVREGIIDPIHLEHIMEEFRASFEDDIVLKKNLKEQDKRSVLQKIESKEDNYENVLGYVKLLLRDYQVWCKEMLLDYVPQDNKKKEIEQLIRCYIPGLISSGYSSEFVCRYNTKIFNTEPVNSFDSLNAFLNRFDFKKRKYAVYIAIDANVIKFRKVLEKRLSVDFEPFKDNIDIPYDKEKYILSRIQITDLDEQSAAKKAYKHLNTFFTYYRLLGEQEENWYFNDVRVVDEKKQISKAVLKTSGLNRSNNQNTEVLASYADYYIISLQSNARKAYQQINRAIDLHNIAIDDIDIKNRFLNFWSTLEILFVSDKNMPTINEIIYKMVPILQKDYLDYLFYWFNTEILKLKEQLGLDSLAEQIEEDKNDILWPIYIAALNKYSAQRDELYLFLKDYPLLRNRLFQLNEMCHNKARLAKIVNEHGERVSWHIKRLYRTRNAIVHSGICPNNLQELTDHLHGYADQCLNELIILLSRKRQLESISNALIDVQFRTEEIMATLHDQSPINKDELLSILYFWSQFS